MTIRVLLVDDSPPFLKAATNLLTGDPRFDVVGTALSGSEALEQIPQLCPDLVLMDLAMPGMNGLETTRRLKARADAPHVIILTLYDNLEYRAAAREALADGYLAKSDLPEELVPLIHRLFFAGSDAAGVAQNETRPASREARGTTGDQAMKGRVRQ